MATRKYMKSKNFRKTRSKKQRGGEDSEEMKIEKMKIKKEEEKEKKRKEEEEKKILAGVNTLKKKIAELNEQDCDGKTPLIAASEEGNIEKINKLFDEEEQYNGEKAEMDPNDDYYISPVEINMNHKDKYDMSALQYASMKGNKDMVELLLRKGAFVSDKPPVNREGNKALHLASKYGYLDIVELLLANGADPKELNDEGQTAMDLATDPDIKNTLSDIVDVENIDKNDNNNNEQPDRIGGGRRKSKRNKKSKRHKKSKRKTKKNKRK